jgi:hypothetical protein
MTPTEKGIELVKTKIDKERKNTFINHMFVTPFNLNITYGETASNTFTLWKMNGWTGSLYYIIEGTIYENNGIAEVELKSSLNPFGRLISFAIYSIFLYAAANVVIINPTSIESWWIRIPLALGLLLIPILLFQLIYGSERRKKVEEIRAWFN